MASSVRDILRRGKLNPGYLPAPAQSPMDAAGLPENSVLGQPGGSVSSAWGFVPPDKKKGQIAETVREAIARAAMDAASNGDPTGLRGRMEKLGSPSEETGETIPDPENLEAAQQGVGQMMAQATGQYKGEPTITNTGSLQSNPNYAKFIEASRAVAQLPPMSNLEATQRGVNMPAMRYTGQFSDPSKLNGGAALQAARSQATKNQTVREAARLAKLDKRASDQKEVATSQAEQWMMQNNPAAYAAIQQAKANQTEANAKLAMANNESPAGKIGLAKSDPVAAAAAGIPQEAIDAGKLQDEIAAGMAGPHTHKLLNDTYTNENWATGPEFAGSKDAFLAHVANNGLGISPQVASQWWDKNIAGTGIRGLATGAMNGAYDILKRLGR